MCFYKIGHLAFDDIQACDLSQFNLHPLAIQLTICLQPWALNRRAFFSIKKAVLDPGNVRDASHQPVECVDLADQVSFPKTSDRRITRHNANRGGLHRDKRRSGTHAAGYSRSFHAGMSTPNHDDVVGFMFHVKHPLFADAEARKYFAKDVFHIDPADQSVKCSDPKAQLFRRKIESPVRFRDNGKATLQMLHSHRERFTMAFAYGDPGSERA